MHRMQGNRVLVTWRVKREKSVSQAIPADRGRIRTKNAENSGVRDETRRRL
jgi:hypothetical protein